MPRTYEKLGAHVTEHDGVAGTHFAVWAPNARRVSVIGDFNGWKPGANPMNSVASSGIWEGFIPGVGAGVLYKYAIVSQSRRLPRREGRPLRLRLRDPPRDRLQGLGPVRLRLGRRRLDGAARRAPTPSTPLSPSTKSISARGCASPRKATAG